MASGPLVSRLSVGFATSLLTFLLLGSWLHLQQAHGSENGTELLEALKVLDPCVSRSIFSFLYQEAYLPTSPAALNASCTMHFQNFKCVKENNKVPSAIVKRAMLILVHNMSRYMKKMCFQNSNSAKARRFMRDAKCIMDRKKAVYYGIESDLDYRLNELVRRNYNDSAVELKYLCCTLMQYRREFIQLAAPECPESRPLMEELMSTLVSDELNLVCEDEEKLMGSVCPSLGAIAVPRSYRASTSIGQGRSVSGLIVYLVATLGESA